ncbi:TonB-dependent receptor [Chondrinema litorale]|uniref:TonB-dependent receptor n=1 Tax=Chondrinema litorale TaxID=2994555 RepID=UPI002542EA25|nr:TonB-dependent receptor [Chondrinema litorale]UZR98978.1 TonB-dependent receptor [Chondrinema litorale]
MGSILIENKKDPAIGASILLSPTSKGAVVDINGKFILNLIPPGEYNLSVSFIGYEQEKLIGIKVEANQTTNIGEILLKEKPLSLNEIVVSPGQFSIMENGSLSKQTLSSEDIHNMSFAEDITRVVARLPGVASNDYSSKFTIRGGEDDEVLITLDGMEFYEPFHQRDFAGGLLSIIDIETIQGVELITGGFSAEYGNRESGVFNLTTKQIKDNQRQSSIGLSVMNARAYTSGTFADNKWNYLVSARKGMLDQALKLIGQDENTPQYYDMMGKLEYKANDKNTFAIYALHAGDKTMVRDISETAYDKHNTKYYNTYLWTSWKAILAPSVFARTLIYAGNIDQNRIGNTRKDEFTDKLNYNLLDKRSFTYSGIKQDWNFDITEKLILKTGFDVKTLKSIYDYSRELLDFRTNNSGFVVPYSDTVSVNKNANGWQSSIYISGKFQIAPKLFLESGIRHDYASYTGDNLLSPRASISYYLSKRTQLRAAWGNYYQTQFIYDLDVAHNNIEFNPAELSKHYILGFSHDFSNGLALRIEGYYKDISRVSPNYQNLRDPWEVYPEVRNDQYRLEVDGASAKGLEFFLKYDVGGKISWWFSYALAHAVENITDLQYDGVLIRRTGTLPRYNNQDHTIYADMNYRPNKKWKFNLSWQFYNGIPLTIYEYKWQNMNGENGSTLPLHFYPEHQLFRGEQFPAYHRMDIRINKFFQLKQSRISSFLHLVNVYNRQNMRKYDLGIEGEDSFPVTNDNGEYIITYDHPSWLGFLPIIGMSWEF